jgi:RimJ/RimL family protein N-acetyltransferase
MTPAQTLTSDRLTLRGPETDDFDAIAAFFADTTRSPGFGGPLPRDQAWRWFASMIGHWHLRGYGFWTVTKSDTSEILGIVGLWNPEGWPEPELGWVMFENAEGKGYAAEAALTVRAYAYGTLGFKTLTSNIVPGNARSVALAERIGATYERTYDNISMGTDMLYRHPAPEARS